MKIVYIKALDHASVRIMPSHLQDFLDEKYVIEVVGFLLKEDSRYYAVGVMRKGGKEIDEYLVFKILKSTVIDFKELKVIE